MTLKIPQRKTIKLSSTSLIKTELLNLNSLLPLVVQPAIDNLDLITWAANHQKWIEIHLIKHGGILFRNFKLNNATEFEQFMTTIAGDLLTYSYRSTPRSQVSEKIYTSTEYPASESIPLHNEMAYALTWPLKIAFFCVNSSPIGGETPIADSRKVFNRISPEIRAKFMEKKVMYVRNYGDKFDLPWQDVFQTTSKREVENYCLQAQIKFEWIDSNHFRTYQICQAVAEHPKTGELVWFNQAHLFHISSLKPEIYQSLITTFKPEDLPRNSYYGDGSEIEPFTLNEIRQTYQQETISFPWQTGDILLLDNMLVAHGRKPYQGDRKILVAMAQSS